MPSLHKIIIRDKETGNGDLISWKSIGLRHDFIKNNNNSFSQNEPHPKIVMDLLASARKEAEGIKKQAQAKAAELMDSAKQKAIAEAERIKADAARQGYDKGYDEGYRAALEEAGKEADKIRARAKSVLVQAEENRREKINNLREEIRDLAIDIAEKIVTKELEIKSDAVLTIAQEAIQLVSNRKYIVLWVHPEEEEICQKHRDQLLKHLPPKAEVHIMTDETVARGGCIVETDYGKVDATLSNRWQTLLKAINEGLDAGTGK
ncbi:FliH/SctL family protein [Desulfoscipio gibsoniae]|uniref:Flagellar biosynthesis/type III secretory pathway protein n=1 Tax=Desulfoscipio gibsoniae DSM 7213 TaxID=767817 RepID=R4KJ52_9FIRM|nr:FliH/SctL family protein [Desulfoscipio gibsoniae]AGL01657.1 flagellar biosynthesis/type III secretory pathway protein [Desulfoscipio gibsoniae DSM 7213]